METKKTKNVSNKKIVYTFDLMEEKKREIIANAIEVYMKYGIKSVTMDEMARQLGISKKTLYLYVKDKNDLVCQAMKFAQTAEICMIEEIAKTYENAIDEMLATSRFIISRFNQIHPSIFFDLLKYHPDAMKIMNDHMNVFVHDCVSQNLNKGIKQGLYRKNLNIEFIATLYLAIINSVMNGDVFDETKFPMADVYREFFKYHLRGIANDNGLEYLIELKKNDENL